MPRPAPSSLSGARRDQEKLTDPGDRRRARPHRDDDQVCENLPGQRLNFRRHRRREEQRLPRLGQLSDNALNIRDEAHAETYQWVERTLRQYGYLTRPRAEKGLLRQYLNDQALVERVNGAVVRKQMGYGHIPQSEAEKIQQFYRETLNAYLNFHRPCGFATEVVDKRRGKVRKRYDSYRNV